MPASLRIPLMRVLGYEIDRSACIWAGASIRSKRIRVGRNVFINVGFFYDGFDQLEIGDNVRMGQFVRVITASHAIGPETQRCQIATVSKPVKIGAGSWIGCNVTLLPGADVAEGCVIGAGSVVTKPTEKNGLYVGLPARLVRLIDQDDPEIGSTIIGEPLADYQPAAASVVV